MNVNTTTLFGVTLRISPSHPSALAVLNHQSHLVNLAPFNTDTELLQLAGTYHPTLIAIGSPLCLPTGLADLEPSANTRAAPPTNRGRQLERELGSLGISCFFTARGSVIRPLIYRGIGLKGALQLRGYEVIEVYPHATKVILFGEQVLNQKGSRGVAYQKERLGSLIAGMAEYRGTLNKNTSDALLNAYTALLHMCERTDLLGDPQEGLLCIPKLLHENLTNQTNCTVSTPLSPQSLIAEPLTKVRTHEVSSFASLKCTRSLPRPCKIHFPVLKHFQ
jgi:predicted nuclease with RNAse H fold